MKQPPWQWRYEKWGVSHSPHHSGHTQWLTRNGWSEAVDRYKYPPKGAVLFKNYHDAIKARNWEGFGKVRRVLHFDLPRSSGDEERNAPE